MSTRPFWARTRAPSVERSSSASLRGVTLPCFELERAEIFYTQLLGMERLRRTANHSLLQAGGVRVILLDATRLPGFTRPRGQAMFLEVAVPDLEATRRRLTLCDVRIFQQRRRGPGALLTIEDPEGNMVNLVQRQERWWSD